MNASFTVSEMVDFGRHFILKNVSEDAQDTLKEFGRSNNTPLLVYRLNDKQLAWHEQHNKQIVESVEAAQAIVATWVK